MAQKTITAAGDGAASPAKKPSATNGAKAKFEIHVDIDDDYCSPSTDDVEVYNGACEVPLCDEDYGFSGEVDEDTAMLEVKAKSFACDTTCRSWQPEVDRSLLQVARGCTTTMTLAYEAGISSIEITPRLTYDGAGDPIEPARAVPGVRFKLYPSAATTGKPLVRVTSPTSETISFTNLRAETVTLVVEPPAKLGDQPIELTDPRSTTLRVNPVPGKTTTLDEQYTFALAAGTVKVHVVDDVDDSAAVPYVPLSLAPVADGAGAEPQSICTDKYGDATFKDVTAGTYRVGLVTDPVQAGDHTWTAIDTPLAVISAKDSEAVVELRLVEDLHIVRGTVYGPDGRPAEHALVEIRYGPEDDEPIITVTDDCGHYEWEAPYAGTFYLTTVQQDGQLRRMVPVSVNSVKEQDLHTNYPNGSGSSGGSSNDQDPTPFPLLVGNVDLAEGTAPGSRSGGGGYGGESSAGATVSAAIRDVLGYRTRTTDTKGFIAALQRSFTCVDKPGYTLCEWTPRSYAATIPADLGALTGAQASIFERAKGSADAILPLLEGLTPLGSATDDEDAEAIKAIVRSRVSEIVDELSIEGGPRTQRVDELFERLTGYRLYPSGAIVFFNVNTLRGELLKLGERLDMDRRNVNTIGEEENFTNFLIIVDSVATLFVIWQQARPFFIRDGADDTSTENDAPFLGTQLVLISRQLGVISETVRECYFAMDSVFLGPAERQTVLLSLDEGGIVIQGSAAPVDSVFPTPRPKTAMLLSELLDWIDRFCTDEGPQLIEEAGTDGVNAFVPTVRRLAQLAKSAAQQSKSDQQIPPSYFTGRVQLSLAQLASQLARAATVADAVFERLNLPDVDNNGSASNQGGWR